MVIIYPSLLLSDRRMSKFLFLILEIIIGSETTEWAQDTLAGSVHYAISVLSSHVQFRDFGELYLPSRKTYYFQTYEVYKW